MHQRRDAARIVTGVPIKQDGRRSTRRSGRTARPSQQLIPFRVSMTSKVTTWTRAVLSGEAERTLHLTSLWRLGD